MLQASASALARRIRDRSLSSRALVDAHIAHLERCNPTLNALVRDRFAEARVEADLADEAIRRGDAVGPFHGVPCSIKEAFALTGMPNTSGLVARKGLVADRDATAVRRLRAAGAIPLGVTNVSELCMWMESDNRVYGRTDNPYDPSRIVGGSSGGEGAVVGAGGAPFGLGSDIGGSIRMPAFFNGVFGHKPSAGLVPGSGQFPMASGAATRYLTTGPLTRKAEDLYPLLRVLAGPDGEDPGCKPMALGDPATVSLEGLDVITVEHNGLVRVQSALIAAQRAACAHLRRRGARVHQVHLPELRSSLAVWSALLAEAGGPSFAELLGQGTAIPVFRELVAWLLGRSDHTLPAIGLALVEKVPALLGDTTAAAIESAARLRKTLDEAIGAHGVMLYPSYPRQAPRHGTPLLWPIQWAYTAVLNVMELPATQVPLGLSGGLPLGVQVVARHGEDHRCLAVASELERAFGGWVPPPRWFS